ncbi:MAG: putative toxin-antitoxin system toxin component, PIN family [Bacteroidaceae bacterium]|nr:putative toxin-antitoxin system toxin component, PIN family [Bacteroidaceae bacterium]
MIGYHNKNFVLDTNVLVMSLSLRNQYSHIWESFVRGDYTLCLTNDIMEEYEEVISRNISPKVARIVISYLLLLPNVRFLDPHYSFGLIKADVDDNKFVDCAIVANASCIVTEDKHFHELHSIEFPKVEIIGIDLFLNILQSKPYQFSEDEIPSLLSESENW